jgi:hypothetical protein
MQELVLTVNFLPDSASMSPFVATLAWNDIVVLHAMIDDVVFPIVLDLHVFVIGPSGAVTDRNMGFEANSLGTIEKVTIADPETDAYRRERLVRPRRHRDKTGRRRADPLRRGVRELRRTPYRALLFGLVRRS